MQLENRPKVVHLTSVHDATDARIVHKECATLSQDGYDVVLISPGVERSLPASVRHRTVPLPRNRVERFTRTIAAVYRAARNERARVYHFHDPELIPVGAVLRLQGARVIFDVHEDIALDIKTKQWIPAAIRPAVSAAAAVVLRAVQRCFSAIVPATPSIAERFTHRRTVVVRNYPKLEELCIDAADNVPFEQRPMKSLYLGNITAVRGIEQMVAAIGDRALPADARLLLAGEFEDEALRARIATMPGWQRVDAPGRLPRAAIASALAGTRMGLLVLQPTASFEHSLPTKLFEYMAAGLPVIVSKFLACKATVEEHACGIVVDPRDPAEIADAMRRLFEDPAGAAEMGERGRAAVPGRYEWTSEARNLIGLYAEILS